MENIKDYTHDIHGRKYNRVLMMIVLLIPTFGALLMQTSLSTAIPTIMQDFNLSLATAQEATTWFLLMNGIIIPVTPFLTMRIPTRWLMVMSYVTVFAGLLLAFCAPTSNWTLFLLGRILQALGTGIVMSLMQVAFANMYPKEERGTVMGIGGFAIMLAPALGPTYAGWILMRSHRILGATLSNSWRSIFLLPMLLMLVGIVLGAFVFHDVVENRKMRLDLLSLLLSTLGFGLFLLGFTNVSSYGWANLANVLTPIGCGLLLLLLFIRRQLSLKDPFLNVRNFLNRQFLLTTAAAGLSTVAMLGVEMMLPMYLQDVRGLSTLSSGLLLLPGALIQGLLAPVAGGLLDRYGAKPLALAGFSLLALGTVPFLFLGLNTSEWQVMLFYGLRMLGIALMTMPLITAALNSLPLEQSAQATASNNTVRQVASAIGTAIMASVTQNVMTQQSPSLRLKARAPLDYADKLLHASLSGYQAAFAIGLGFAVVGFLLSLFLRNKKSQ